MKCVWLPPFAPPATWNCVTDSLVREPRLVWLTDMPGLLVAACLDAAEHPETDRGDRLRWAAATPRRTLAEKLGVPSLKVLQRLTGDALCTEHIARLKTACNDAYSFRILRHSRYVSPALIDALTVEGVHEHYESAFLHELGTRFRDYCPRAVDVVGLGLFLHAYRPKARITSMDVYHDALIKYYEPMRRHEAICQCWIRFPAPPWPDDPGYVVALATPGELLAESIVMDHCAGWTPQFTDAVEASRGYFYKIEGNWGLPRATLYCVRCENCWRVGELRGKRNSRLAQHLVRCVAAWVAERQGLRDAELCLPRLNEELTLEAGTQDMRLYRDLPRKGADEDDPHACGPYWPGVWPSDLRVHCLR